MKQKKHFYKKLCLFLSFLTFVWTQSSMAVVRVDITGGHVEPLPIAVLPFLEGEGSYQKIGEDVSNIIKSNLESSGLFRVVNPVVYPQSPENLKSKPHFPAWRNVKAQALIHGFTKLQSDGRIRVEFRLWDVLSQQQLTGLAYYSEPRNWRRVAHIISDNIYKALTGEEGYFDTRVVYVSESGTVKKPIKRLAIMDQDGANHRFLTDGARLVSTPRFSPTSQEIAFLSFDSKQPKVYLYNIETGRQEVLGDFPGITFAPRFSADGQSLVLSMALNGNTDLYTVNLNTRKMRRITQHPSIDTAPSFSPDGQRIAFESDRSGSQQIYVMDIQSGTTSRVSFGEGNYATPVWSPRGDLIAFTRIYQGRFFIGVMRPDGSEEKLLAESFHVEGPSWAPNGRVLMYFRQARSSMNGQSTARLYSIDISGFNEREVITPTNASDPAWSPKLP